MNYKEIKGCGVILAVLFGLAVMIEIIDNDFLLALVYAISAGEGILIMVLADKLTKK